MKNKVYSPLLAGVLIGIAGCAYLNTGGVAGAALFAFGLLGVVNWKLDLFTGRSGFWSGRKILQLIPVLLLNIAGVAAVALVSMKPESYGMALGIIEKRMAANPVILFFLSSLCGLIMTTAVKFGKEGNWWPLLFGVPTFIMSGFPHCIADIYYWTAALQEGYGLIEILPVYLVTVAGNYAGCNIPRLIPGFVAEPASGAAQAAVEAEPSDRQESGVS